MNLKLSKIDILYKIISYTVILYVYSLTYPITPFIFLLYTYFTINGIIVKGLSKEIKEKKTIPIFWHLFIGFASIIALPIYLKSIKEKK